MKGLPMTTGELIAARRYLAASIAAGSTKVTRSSPRVTPARKNWSYSMSPRAIKQRAARGVVIPADGKRPGKAEMLTR
jgi:hypothetical protein